jgi:putative tricarboxylic transport membrane protein
LPAARAEGSIVIEAAASALEHVFTGQYLLWLLVGTAMGMFIGLIPGLGGSVGMALLLPFVFGMDAFTGLALLMGMAAVAHTSDTFPSVLLGIPCSSGPQATIMDGCPLAQQGQASRALGRWSRLCYSGSPAVRPLPSCSAG